MAPSPAPTVQAVPVGCRPWAVTFTYATVLQHCDLQVTGNQHPRQAAFTE